MGLLYWLESIRTAGLDAVMSLITHLGGETVFLLVVMITLWCLDKRWGFRMMFLGLAGSGINQLLKAIFLIPRPWVKDPAFTIVEKARAAATGYSFPSGHSQSIATLSGSVGLWRKKAGWWIAMILISLLVGFSRMYLGVHTPLDVGVGLISGWALIWVCGVLFQKADQGNSNLLTWMLWAGFALCLLALLYVLLFPAREANVAEFDQHGLHSLFTLVGTYLGGMAGLWMDQKKTDFQVDAIWWAQILKLFIGLALVVGIKVLLKAPINALCGGLPVANALRYFLMGIVGAGLWPMTFAFWAKLGQRK